MMEEEISFGLGYYTAVLKRRKKQLVLPFFLILLMSVLIALGLPSIYRSEATILIEQQEIPSEFVRSTVTSFAGERIQVISQRVMTTDNLAKIINDYDLYPDRRENTSSSLLAEDLRKDIDLEMISADVVDPRSGRPTTATIAFKLSFSHTKPNVTQKVTNALVSLYLDENLRQRTQSALETSSFLEAEAGRLNKEVTTLEVALASFKEKHIKNLPELQQLNLQLMERNERELSNTLQQIRNLEDRKIYLNSELSQISPVTDIYNSSGKRVMGMEDRLRALQAEYTALSTRYTDDHPTLAKMKSEIQALETGLNSAPQDKVMAQSSNPAYIQLETQLQSVESELASLLNEKEKIKLKISDFEARLLESPQVEREYRDLMRNYDNALSKYQEVKEKQLEAELAESLERERKGERFSLIEPPQLPETPDKPNRIAILLVGVFLSVVGGVGNVALKESIDDAVHDSRDVVDITKLQPLATIPYIENEDDRRHKKVIFVFGIFGAFVGLGAVMIYIHMFYKPLDVIWFVVLRHVGL